MSDILDKINRAAGYIALGGAVVFMLGTAAFMLLMLALGIYTVVAANLIYAPVIAAVGTALYFIGKFVYPKT